MTRTRALGMIRKLFAKARGAADVGSMEEAEAFEDKAQALMLKHGITQAEVDPPVMKDPYLEEALRQSREAFQRAVEEHLRWSTTASTTSTTTTQQRASRFAGG